MLLASQLILNGNVGQEPKSVGKGETAMAAFTVAVSQGKDKDPAWVDIICFDMTAEGVLEHVEKGSPVLITGRLAQDTWEQDGGKRTKLKCIADDVAIKALPEKAPF